MTSHRHTRRRRQRKAATLTCPRCMTTTHHPEDVAQGYCGRCHWWTSDPILGSPEVIAQAEASGAIVPVEP